jgi:hypothetical protein
MVGYRVKFTFTLTLASSVHDAFVHRVYGYKKRPRSQQFAARQCLLVYVGVLTEKQNFAAFHSVRFRIIGHLSNYTKQMHDTYPLHIFNVFFLHVSVFLTPLSGRTLCPLLKTTRCYAASIYFTTIVTS